MAGFGDLDDVRSMESPGWRNALAALSGAPLLVVASAKEKRERPVGESFHASWAAWGVYGFVGEQEKAEFERRQFLRAAAIAGIEVVPDSVENRRPPEPDILCILKTRETVAFELVELVDSDQPRTVARTLKNPDSAEAFSFDPTMATRR